MTMRNQRDYERMQHRLATNPHQRCTVDRCPRNRHGTGRYCITHASAAQRTGHPEGHGLYPKDYAKEREEVDAFLRQHAESRPYLAAQHLVQTQWLLPVGRPNASPGELLRARLRGHGIAPAEVIRRGAAVWLYARRNPERLPSDLRLTFALAHGVWKLIPARERKGAVGPVAAKEAGGSLRDLLYPVFGNIAQGIAQQHQQHADAVSAIREPFTPTKEAA